MKLYIAIVSTLILIATVATAVYFRRWHRQLLAVARQLVERSNR